MIFNFNLNDHTQALADYLPNGKMFEAKNIDDSNFRQLLRGFAGELFTAQGYLTTLEKEYFPDLTTLFLSEWEQALGIPDGCFLGTGTTEERRRDILVKLSALGVQTAEDFVGLAAVFGVTVVVQSGSDVAPFPMSFPLLFVNSASDAAYILLVDFPAPIAVAFPYDFPVIFGDSTQVILKCLFRKLAPANCQVVFRTA